VQISLNSDFDISDKERSRYLVAVGKNCEKMKKSGKRWKILRLISIVFISIF